MSTSKDSAKKNAKVLQAIAFIEELGWVLNSSKGLDLRTVSALLKEELNSASNMEAVAGRYVAPNPNKHFLIGVLPRLFQDTSLFPTNEDIADFARTVLEIRVTRYEKRSKYELIGLVVCQTNLLNDEKLSHLVRALEDITSNEEKMERIIAVRMSKTMSWNEAIELIGGAKSSEQGD